MIDTYIKQINDHLVRMTESTEHVQLNQMLNEAILIGGKRIRPILCLIAARMFHDDYQHALPQACALELFHTFSLVHDDIMDEAPTRRGEPSVYFRHGRDQAILAGDVILILAYAKLVEGLDLEKSQRVVACFTDTAVKVCEGQMFDMDFEAKHFPDQVSYMKMIELKTSVLIGAALKLGAIVGGGSDSDAEKLYQYGLLNGLAFQIQDDILDAFGDPALVGKRVGGDIVQGKKTLLAILCAEKSGDDRQIFEELFFDNDMAAYKKIFEVMAWYEKLGVKNDAIQVRNTLIQQAADLLNHLDVQDSKKSELRQLSNWLLNRTH
jgi:geranylgeranyl diphosphate synthase type II